MEFYVVDPKNLDFDNWTTRVRDFLTEESFNYVEATGQVFYLGDDVAILGMKIRSYFPLAEMRVVSSKSGMPMSTFTSSSTTSISSMKEK